MPVYACGCGCEKCLCMHVGVDVKNACALICAWPLNVHWGGGGGQSSQYTDLLELLRSNDDSISQRLQKLGHHFSSTLVGVLQYYHSCLQTRNPELIPAASRKSSTTMPDTSSFPFLKELAHSNHVLSNGQKRSQQKPEIKDCFIKCPTDLMSCLKTKLRERWLTGLDAQKHCQLSQMAYHTA